MVTSLGLRGLIPGSWESSFRAWRGEGTGSHWGRCCRSWTTPWCPQACFLGIPSRVMGGGQEEMGTSYSPQPSQWGSPSSPVSKKSSEGISMLAVLRLDSEQFSVQHTHTHTQTESGVCTPHSCHTQVPLTRGHESPTFHVELAWLGKLSQKALRHQTSHLSGLAGALESHQAVGLDPFNKIIITKII